MAVNNGMLNKISVTIANGASLSSAVNFGGGEIVGIEIPTWTSAALTFQHSLDGSTFVEMRDAAGVALTIADPASATGFRVIPASTFGRVKTLKVRSGTSAAPVNQGAARTLVFLVVF